MMLVDRLIGISRDKRTVMGSVVVALLIVTLACSLPGLSRRVEPTATPGSTALPSSTPSQPTATPQPLPPTVVETDPLPGVEVPLDGAFTFYFNQPMERNSVEAALSSAPALEGGYTWVDDATLVFAPDQSLPPDSEVTFELGSGARSLNGLSTTLPVSYQFQTGGYLSLEHALPEAEASEVNPTSAVVAAFNYPVVPLGADPAGLPAGFSLEPAAQGRGEWINTSTYIFYPEPALEGGKSYRMSITPELRGLNGSPLQEAQSWSFTTASPRLVTLEPDPNAGTIRLDSTVALTFNQPMDSVSVEAGFSLLGPDQEPVPGAFAWEANNTKIIFTPASLLARDSIYTVLLNGSAQARGGTPLGNAFEASLFTVPPLAVSFTGPAENGLKQIYEGVSFNLNGPVGVEDVDPYVSVIPTITNQSVWWDEYGRVIYVYGDYLPDTDYVVTLAASLPDPWDGTLGQDTALNFRTQSLPPAIYLTNSSDVLFLTLQDASIPAQVTNMSTVSTAQGSTSLGDFVEMVGGENGYAIRQGYTSPDQKSWQQALDVPVNVTKEVPLYLSPDRQPLPPGLYYMRIDAPQQQEGDLVTLLVVSNIHLTFKLSPTEALVWVVDLRQDKPLEGAPITILDNNGAGVASGLTDADGVFRSPIPTKADGYTPYYAILGVPGEENFSLALSTWNSGTAPWEFGISSDYSGPRLKAYLYTDRPIYRSGQTVYFRAVVRDAYNGRYTIPDLATLPLTLYKNYGEEIANLEVPLSPSGTAHGEYVLPPDAQPGDYRLSSKLAEYDINVYFQVAEYRKPEINLQVDFDQEQVLSGEKLTAQINARYFFDAPAGNLPVQWSLMEAPSYVNLPGYQVGIEDTRWLRPFYFPGTSFGSQVDSGQARTDAQGLLNLEFLAEATDASKRYTLEVTASDEGGLPVSGRDSAEVHPAEYHIGVRPEAWVGRAGEESGFEILAVDWDLNPAGSRSLRGEFQKVVWVRQESELASAAPPGFYSPTFVPEYTPVGSTDFTTNGEGLARISFTPPEPGTYQLDVSGDGARTQALLWVGGSGQAVWPNLPNQRLRLTADRKEYMPGDTARIFIPNPFTTDTLALLTVERSLILSHQVVTLPPGGDTVSVPLSPEEAPNVYVAATLMGRDERGLPSYRQGYLNLAVAPLEQTLTVSLINQPERAGPGDEVTYDVMVSDASGTPVQGEFSLSLVDLATLALADPNAPDIVPAFYGEQPLGVRTGLPLGAYPQTENITPAGGGGGGGDFVPTFVRERFPDTAYWNAEIQTDASGHAQVRLALPDNLTTWQASARGVTQDTRVGQADTRLVTTKELLLRPVVPRFLVAGDHLQLAAVAQNNTAQEIQALISLQANGFSLDDPAAVAQTATLPPNGRLRIEWWGTVQDVESLDLIFEASGGGYQDAVRPAAGKLPVLRYTAPQTFATSGILEEEGERLELVSLPRSFDSRGGNLHVELSSSLAGSVMAALDVLEYYPYECTEQTLARFLPNLELYRALQATGTESPSMRARLDRTLSQGLERLQAYQNSDGGWSWWQGGESDTFVTAYVLFGLLRAQEAGAAVSPGAIQRGVDYLTATLTPPQSLSQSWQLDRLAFIHYVLSQAGPGSMADAQALYPLRDQLNPWAQAFLALAINTFAPGSDEVRTLVSDLESSAIRSATGAHWEEKEPGYINMSSPISTSAIVVYALVQLDPQAPVVSDGMRYLVLNRQGDHMWGSTYSTAWTVMATAEVIASTGELAGDFAFSSQVNGSPMASGHAGGDGATVASDVAVANLYPDYPNALTIQRDAGPGSLYYTAALNVFRPVEEVSSLDRGISISRSYYPYGEDCLDLASCPAIQEAQAGELIKVRLVLTLKNDAYYLMVEDYLPAGSEILNTRLKTSQQAIPEEPPAPLYDASSPYQEGWGWWLFDAPQVYDDHIAWSADYLPAGAYELTYYLSVLQPGEYRVLPARAWQFYFPEVQGNGTGTLFAIKP